MGILNGILYGDFEWGFCMGNSGGVGYYGQFFTLCVFLYIYIYIYIHYRHYKCELALLMPIAQSGSASLPVALRVLLRPNMLGFQVIRPGKSTGETRDGVFKWGFKWGFCNGDFERFF